MQGVAGFVASTRAAAANPANASHNQIQRLVPSKLVGKRNGPFMTPSSVRTMAFSSEPPRMSPWP